MARSEAKTVEEYLDELTDDRRETVEAVRDVVNSNLPDGYEETVQFGMISYVVPLERYPKTYNRQALQYTAIASQKNYVSLYLMNVYGNEETQSWFVDSYRASGKRLDMGKACVRFKRIDDLPLDLIGETIARTPVDELIALYETARGLR